MLTAGMIRIENYFAFIKRGRCKHKITKYEDFVIVIFKFVTC